MYLRLLPRRRKAGAHATLSVELITIGVISLGNAKESAPPSPVALPITICAAVWMTDPVQRACTVRQWRAQRVRANPS